MATDNFSRMFSQMIESGQEIARSLNPALEDVDLGAFERMIPTLPADMLEMWFGKTFNRDGLDAKTRLLVTLAGLVAQGAMAEPQIRLTIRHAREAGATHREVAEVIYQMGMIAGVPAMQKALSIAGTVFKDEEGEDAS